MMRDRYGPVLEEVIMGLHRRGVQLIAGTDAGTDNCPHGAYACSLEALAGAGLPARDVLDAGTARAARAIGVGERTGSIEPGKDADLIAVRGDPLRDISVLHQAELIVARGTQVAPPRPGWVHAARGGYGPAMAEPARQGPA